MPSRDPFLRPSFGAGRKEREEKTRVTREKSVPSLMDIFSIVAPSIKLGPHSFSENLFKRQDTLVIWESDLNQYQRVYDPLENSAQIP